MISLSPIGYVTSPRTDLADDGWASVEATIELDAGFGPESLDGLDAFSHAEILFHFHRVREDQVVRGLRHPRGNTAWPEVGIFAQRGKDRPNRLGSTIVAIVSRQGRTLRVRGLDAADGTPVLDIKPVMKEFLPKTDIRQPAWASELMRGYWTGR